MVIIMNGSLLKKTALLLICFAAMAFALTGCKSKKDKSVYKGYYVFGINATETKVAYEKFKPVNDSSTALIDEFIKKMEQEPSDIAMKKAIPDDVKIDDYVLTDSGELSLYLNAAYSNYTFNINGEKFSYQMDGEFITINGNSYNIFSLDSTNQYFKGIMDFINS